MVKYLCFHFLVKLGFFLMLIGQMSAFAGSKVDVYGIHMMPYSVQARDYSRPGWGLGANIVLTFGRTYQILAGTIGLEYVNLLSKSIDKDGVIEGVYVPYELSTDQGYFRLFFGPQIGSHSHGFFRPYAGANIAIIVYGIDTDIKIGEKYLGDDRIEKNIQSELRVTLGYDFTLGCDLNFSDKFSILGGVKYLKSFFVPQQLGEGSVQVYPQYFQIFLGVGIPITTKEFD